jgi:hypothetical protein
VALDAGCEVAYFPGLAMRRIADLHPGAAKTDARDAYVIADAARTLPHTLRRVDTGGEEFSRGVVPQLVQVALATTKIPKRRLCWWAPWDSNPQPAD